MILKQKSITIFLYFFIFEHFFSCAYILESKADSIFLKAFHIPLMGEPGQKEYILSTIDKLEEYKFNTLVIMANNKVVYDSFPEITSSESENMREVLPGYKPMSKNNLKEIVAYSRKKKIDVIPGVEFLTHQSMFLRKSHPELMMNEETYDPNNPDVYRIVYSIIDELIDIFKPKYFHIGHDEMREYWRKSADNQSKLPSYKAFADDVNKITGYLRNKHVKTMMWGDMLLRPADFSSTLSTEMFKSFHGELQDYYKAIELIDKDIIIVDWHYYVDDHIFPSVDFFLSKGFSVMGATWKNSKTTSNFANYICSKKDPRIIGMMATTWYHFNIREASVIDQIIIKSAQAFSICNN